MGDLSLTIWGLPNVISIDPISEMLSKYTVCLNVLGKCEKSLSFWIEESTFDFAYRFKYTAPEVPFVSKNISGSVLIGK